MSVLFAPDNQLGYWTNKNIQYRWCVAWTPNGVPTTTDSVVIFGVCTILSDSTAHARHVKVEENWVLQIERDLLANAPGRLNLMPFNMTEEVGLVINGTLLQGGRLNINDYPSHAVINNGFINCQDRSKTIVDAPIDNKSHMEISGEVTIDALAFDYCMSNEGDSLIVREGGVLNVAGAVTGIQSEENSSLLNKGSVMVDNIDNDGINNHGILINEDAISIETCQNGIVNNTDSITNLGTVLIKNCDNGIINNENGYIINLDTIFLDSIEDHGILNSAHIANEGAILIQDNYQDELGAVVNNNSACIVNSGLIQCDNINSIGLSNVGTFANQGVLKFNDLQKDAIRNIDSLINFDGGVIEITNGAELAILNQIMGKIENFGLIQAKFIESTAIQNSGVFLNHDTTIVGSYGLSGLVNFSEFSNSSGSYLRIEDDGYGVASSLVDPIVKSYQKGLSQPVHETTPYGILNISANLIATISNEGKIEIIECQDAIRNNGQFINGDTLLIYDVLGTGINNAQVSEEESVDTEFDNSGYIDIQADFGLLVGMDTDFINEESAVLKVISDDDEPLIVELSGVLDCFGELDISSGMNTSGTGQ